MYADLIVHHLNELVTCRGENKLRCGEAMKDVEIIQDGYIAVSDGVFIEVGLGEGYQQLVNEETILIDGTGLVCTPGLIDSHTHLVHGGSRENEFQMKLNGVPYLDILKQGGGILSTVKATKKASFDMLYDKAKKSLDRMLEHGVTMVEAKSGYGLNLDTEIKQLMVAKKLNEDHPVLIKSTFMGAHAVPVEYQSNKEVYIEELFGMLEVIKQEGLAEYCDVFCEEGVFTIDESKRILEKAKALGFKLKIHADEIVPLGGATLACELGCVSADHLMASTKEDILNLAKHQVVANLLPGTSFSLNKDYANARLMIDMGCGVSLSSDYNPGSCPSENIQLVMQLGSLKLRMTPKEVITAVTMNAACCLNGEKTSGSIDIGKKADFVLFDSPNLDYILYHFGINHVKDVFIDGKMVVKDRKICYGE